MDKIEINDELIIPYNTKNILIDKNDIFKLFYNYSKPDNEKNIDENINIIYDKIKCSKCNSNNINFSKEYSKNMCFDCNTFWNDEILLVHINNIDNYIKSLTHKSYIKSQYTMYHNSDIKKIKSMMKNVIELRDESSERLEFYGDTVIKSAVSKYLIIRYPKEDEGFLTRLKTKIENRKTLALFATILGLPKFLIISQQIELNNGRESNKLLEDAFEAFIGALKLDLGDQICEKILFKLLENEIDYAAILYNDTNFKDILLRYFHQNNWSHPIYEDQGSYTSNNKKFFIINVKNNLGEIIATAEELSKKKAEQKASMIALLKYKILREDQIVNEFDT